MLAAILGFLSSIVSGFVSKMFTTPAITTKVKTNEGNIKTDPNRDDALDRLRRSL
jgi:hypothetical protein